MNEMRDRKEEGNQRMRGRRDSGMESKKEGSVALHLQKRVCHCQADYAANFGFIM